MNKLFALCIIPLIPLALLIDIVFGDAVTGVTISPKEKLKEHIKLWRSIWAGD